MIAKRIYNHCDFVSQILRAYHMSRRSSHLALVLSRKSFVFVVSYRALPTEEIVGLVSFRSASSVTYYIPGEMVAMSDYLEISDERFSSKIKLNYYWLRDHCRCGKCYDGKTAQRKFNFMDIPLTVRPKNYDVGETLRVTCEYYQEIWFMEKLCPRR